MTDVGGRPVHVDATPEVPADDHPVQVDAPPGVGLQVLDDVPQVLRGGRPVLGRGPAVLGDPRAPGGNQSLLHNGQTAAVLVRHQQAHVEGPGMC